MKAAWLAASIAGALGVAGSARAATRFVFSTFKSDAVADEKLFTYESSDGLNFQLIAATGYSGPSPGTLRDPSIVKYADGKYYVAYTNPQGAGCCGKEDHFSIASSADLIHWTELTTVKGALPNLAHVWAPEWFVEGSTVNVIVNMDTGASDFQPYVFTALDTSLTSWGGPVPMGIGKDYIDTFVLKVGSTYHAFVKSELTRYLEHATASKLTGPWTFVGKDDWAGWGPGMEGPTIVKLDDGTWRMFVDPQQAGFFYTDSPDLKTWSKAAPLPGLSGVVRHGTVIRDVPVGGGAGGSGGASGAADAGGFAGASMAGTSGSTEAGGASASAGAAALGEASQSGGGVGGRLSNIAGASEAGGAPAAGGQATVAGSGGASSGTSPANSDAGCSCRISPTPVLNAPWLSALLAGFVLRARRRQHHPRKDCRTPAHPNPDAEGCAGAGRDA